MVLVLIKYISCINGGYRCHSGASHQLLVIFLVVESILFGLFTLCMLGDQVSAIQSNQTQIDRLKNTKATTYQNEVNEVCGSARTERFQWQWLLPIKVLPLFKPCGLFSLCFLIVQRFRWRIFLPSLTDAKFDMIVFYWRCFYCVNYCRHVLFFSCFFIGSL